MSILFDPMKTENMNLKNRFVRSATYDGCADRDGHVTEYQLKLFADLAEGGVSLIITGITHVHSSGQSLLFQNSIAIDDVIPGFKRLTETVHDRGAKIALQLFHGGREAAKFFTDKDFQAIAPSVVPDDPYFDGESRQMNEDEIWEIIDAYGDAAKRARKAGFDAVQLHGAHGYLPSQFLSPHTNRREDRWGGVLQNRLRFHQEIYKNIKAKAGKDYPVLIKIGVQDGFSGGLESKEGKVAAKLLAQWGYEALEISLGLRGRSYKETEFRTNVNKLAQEAYYRHWCKAVKSEVDVPTMIVGGLRTYDLMEEVIQKGEADFVSLCRPFIREPDIVNQWKKGDRHRATCISCNKCLEALREGGRLECVQAKMDKTG